MKLLSLLILGSMTLLMACGAGRQQNDSAAVIEETSEMQPAAFDADSAYAYVARQMDFGARVPGSEAHSRTAQWLASELERHGAMVYQQRAELKAFDGTILQAVNIAGSYNTQATDRVLLLAHWDSRPWADRDSVVANRSKPVPGANDGASGVGVLLEIARQLGIKAPLVGVDILFVDAEDWGTDNQDDSWALGARYFAENWYLK